MKIRFALTDTNISFDEKNESLMSFPRRRELVRTALNIIYYFNRIQKRSGGGAPKYEQFLSDNIILSSRVPPPPGLTEYVMDVLWFSN